ncbi:hypothetical protein FLAT13_03382 [Flavobacterium salmonis]|uniref:Uncharacterized protein n=1 Tax=Flavobacterium salmonis TaxID=2654844 RepID=A0A6V6Z5C8_9FLAO|nr:hypothetical protein FLAT13_03382 [Flavobacterium salmonis]
MGNLMGNVIKYYKKEFTDKVIVIEGYSGGNAL